MKYLGQIIDGEDLVNKEYVDDEVATKQDTLVSGTNIKTINGTSVLGSGDITVSGGGGTSTWWGTSSTSASTTAKSVTCSGFVLTTGAVISVYFSTGNTASAPTLNVDSTGAKSIYVGNSVCSGTTNVLKWSAYTILTFIYDGTYWKYLTSISAGDVTPSRGANTWYGTSSSTSSSTAKTSSITNYVLTKGATVSIAFSNENTADTLTLNINSTGAKTVYRGNNSVSSTNPLKWSAGETLTFMYDGTYYRYLASSLRVTSNTPTITASTGVLDTVECYKYGRVVEIAIRSHNTSSVASGSNMFAGTLANADLIPVTTYASGAGYISAHPMVGSISNTGAIIIRNASPSALSANSACTMSFTYIVAS